jgi:hypothetical protein
MAEKEMVLLGFEFRSGLGTHLVNGRGDQTLCGRSAGDQLGRYVARQQEMFVVCQRCMAKLKKVSPGEWRELQRHVF